jgi:hypothetical protein
MHHQDNKSIKEEGNIVILILKNAEASLINSRWQPLEKE